MNIPQPDLAKISLEINSDGDITLKTDLEINLPPAMIADTGIVIEAKKINISLDSSKPKGVYNKEGKRYNASSRRTVKEQN